MFPGINHQCARGPECVWVTRAIRGRSRTRQEKGEAADGEDGNPPAPASVTQDSAHERYRCPSHRSDHCI